LKRADHLIAPPSVCQCARDSGSGPQGEPDPGYPAV